MAKKKEQVAGAALRKVETRLKGADVARFDLLFAMSGCRSQAEFVRRCVLADDFGEWRKFSERMAGLQVTLNRLGASLEAGTETERTALGALIEVARARLGEMARRMPERRRG